MNKRLMRLALVAWLCLAFQIDIYAQNEPKALGTVEQFLDQLSPSKNTNLAPKVQNQTVTDKNDTDEVILKIKHRTESNSSVTVVGSVEGRQNSSFFIQLNDNKVKGHVILKDQKMAYEYFSDEEGNVYIQEQDINKVICIEYPSDDKKKAQTTPTTQNSTAAQAANDLQSFPGAQTCVLLDFDGHNLPAGSGWMNGNAWYAPPSGMSDGQIQETWEIVSEDFRPYNVNITTSQAVFDSYPEGTRMRCIFTPDNAPAPGAGGVAYISSFGNSIYQPCWVFMMDAKAGGEAASHEIGHTVGLGHDGRTNPEEGYFAGHGEWAPIMGVGYYRPISQWSRGEYAYANNGQDDLAVMSNFMPFRGDDIGNSFNNSSTLSKDAGGNVFFTSGVISGTGDIDMFRFTCGSGNTTLYINTVDRHGNLDVLVNLYEGSSGNLIGVFNGGGLNTHLSASLTAGIYYIGVDGTGSGNPATDGYSDYSSMGAYTITGYITPESGVASVYQDCNYGGYFASLQPGEYNLASLTALGVLNDDLSSVTLENGYQIEAFWDDNFGGSSIVIDANTSCLDGTWNDQISSLIVSAINTGSNGVSGLSGTYVLENRNSGLVMDVAYGDPANGTNILQWHNTGAANQQFTLNEVSVGVYSLINMQTGKAVDIDAVSSANFANVHQWDYVGGANQQFMALDAGGGFYKFKAMHSNKIIEVGYASLDADANINQYDDNNQTCGQWRLLPTAPAWSTQIEAENTATQSGTQTEACSEGGLNVGWIDTDDWMVWDVNIPSSGSYTVEYRVASAGAGGSLQLENAGGSPVYGSIGVPGTGGWQNWSSISHQVSLNAGQQQIAIKALAGGWNLNWLKISSSSGSRFNLASQDENDLKQAKELSLFPNPATDRIHLNGLKEGTQYVIHNQSGQVVLEGFVEDSGRSPIDISPLERGIYVFRELGYGNVLKFMKK